MKGRPIVPLGGISNSLMVLCNESGSWATYKSDEHGFNNPVGLWSRQDIEVGVLGDSYINGSCVPFGKDVSSHIRQKIPGTLNLGMIGNGPLFMLAGIKEYLVELKPKFVVWAFYGGNDISDTGIESKSPILTRYLQSDGRQGFLENQHLVDIELKKYSEIYLEYSDRMQVHAAKGIGYLKILKRMLLLRNIRQRFEISAGITDYSQYKKILFEAKRTVNSWGGKLIFLYLPSWETVAGQSSTTYEKITSIVTGAEIEYVDGLKLFRSKNLRLDQLFYRPHGHYSEMGYKVIGEKVLTLLGVRLKSN